MYNGGFHLIQYAHFEVHIECSLEKMDKVWLVIHKNKEIFQKLGIHKYFNISKFHSIIHYIFAICTHRALDSYNTKSPEHLHIDFVKIPFRAGNKQDYTVQITTWISYHNAVWHYGSFLCWVKGEGITKKREKIIKRGEDDDNDGGRAKEEVAVKG